LDNLFCDQTAVGCQGILWLFAIFPIFLAEEGYRFFYQIEAEKRFSSVEIQEKRIRQKR
jgi:hypothetical protein